MAITCCLCDVSVLEDPVLYRKALAELPWPERAAKLERFRFDKDKRLCLGAGLLAAAMLREAGAECLDVSRTPFGKPFLTAHPEICFNISHDGSSAVCAVSGTPVGVDVMDITEYDSKLAATVLGPRELERTEASSDRGAAFARLWVRKESCLKLYGTGLTDNLKALCVLPGESPAGLLFSEFTEVNSLIAVCSKTEVCAELTLRELTEMI